MELTALLNGKNSTIVVKGGDLTVDVQKTIPKSVKANSLSLNVDEGFGNHVYDSTS